MRYKDPTGHRSGNKITEEERTALQKEIIEFARNCDGDPEIVQNTEKGKFKNFNSQRNIDNLVVRMIKYTKDDKSEFTRMRLVYQMDENNKLTLTEFNKTDFKTYKAGTDKAGTDKAGTREIDGSKRYLAIDPTEKFYAKVPMVVAHHDDESDRGSKDIAKLNHWEEYDIISGEGMGTFLKSDNGKYYRYTEKNFHEYSHGYRATLKDTYNETTHGKRYHDKKPTSEKEALAGYKVQYSLDEKKD